MPVNGDRSGPVLSVIVPVLDEIDVLPELRRRLEAALGELDGGYELIWVDDGSSDGSTALLEGWARDDARSRLVVLSRNFGMEVAMSAGLDHARGDFVALMHADLQDPPELLPEMLARARAESADVVYARRIGRRESAVKRALATAFYAMMRRVAQVPYQGQAGDFRLMSRRVVDHIRAMPERRRFLRAMVAWVGFKQVPIDYERAGRAAGRGASYPQLFRLAGEAIASFSDVPLYLATYLGMATALVSATGSLVLAILWLLDVVEAGSNLFVLVAVLFLGGVQLVTIGILGRYLARVHAEALERPLYLVDRVVERTPAGAAEPTATAAGRG